MQASNEYDRQRYGEAASEIEAGAQPEIPDMAMENDAMKEIVAKVEAREKAGFNNNINNSGDIVALLVRAQGLASGLIDVRNKIDNILSAHFKSDDVKDRAETLYRAVSAGENYDVYLKAFNNMAASYEDIMLIAGQLGRITSSESFELLTQNVSSYLYRHKGRAEALKAGLPEIFGEDNNSCRE